MLKIALTGSIASGKTTVLAIFQKLGAATIDSDKIVSELYRREDVKKQILSLFQTLDKKQISSQIFSNPKKRRLLEQLLHPLVEQEIEKRTQSFESNGEKLVVIEVPLLFEAGLEHMFDKVIAITCPQQQQLSRLQQQGLSKQQALSRINAQLPQKEKVKKSDFTIDNSSSPQQLQKQVEKMLSDLNG